MNKKSRELFQKALKLMPGGVNSPVRAFRAVGGDPVFIARGKGSSIVDVDGRSYIDYVLSWGPLILGHSHPEVVEALARALERGTSFGACTEGEIELAVRICDAYPSIERVRLVNSGTEATLSALRVARAATGRERILKFEGCYHGHGDSLLVKAGSGVATLGLPDSPGVPRALAELTVTVPFNDPAALEEAFRVHANQLAAVILEPVVGNAGCIPPKPGFLEKLRGLTAGQGTVLIFDEVMTGFRVAYGGAQELFKIQPDLTTLGKIIGGGLPVGAYGGRKDIMSIVFAAAAEKAGVPLTVNRVGSMFTCFFTNDSVADYSSAKKADTARFARFFRSLLGRGVYFPPSQFEAAFVSTAHHDSDVATTVEAATKAFEEIW